MSHQLIINVNENISNYHALKAIQRFIELSHNNYHAKRRFQFLEGIVEFEEFDCDKNGLCSSTFNVRYETK